MTAGARFALTISIVLAALLGLSLCGYDRWQPAQEYSLASAETRAEPPQVYEGIPLDRHLLELDKQALDEAYHAHLLLLFSVWLKDIDSGPKRFQNGLRIARRAYHDASQQIQKREQELNK